MQEQRNTTLGLLGGGQLGKFFIQAAQRHGFRVVLLAPEADCPAAAVADLHLCADYQNPQALAELASHAFAITCEFEHIPVASLAQLSKDCRVSPAAACFEIAQNRAKEKAFLTNLTEKLPADIQVACAPYFLLENATDLAQVPDVFSQPF